jgi:hypothetical protein
LDNGFISIPAFISHKKQGLPDCKISIFYLKPNAILISYTSVMRPLYLTYRHFRVELANHILTKQFIFYKVLFSAIIVYVLPYTVGGYKPSRRSWKVLRRGAGRPGGVRSAPTVVERRPVTLQSDNRIRKGQVAWETTKNGKPGKGILRKEGLAMLTLEGLVGILSLVLGAFSLGYAIGKDRGRSDSESKTQKWPPKLCKSEAVILWLTYNSGWPSIGSTFSAFILPSALLSVKLILVNYNSAYISKGR